MSWHSRRLRIFCSVKLSNMIRFILLSHTRYLRFYYFLIFFLEPELKLKMRVQLVNKVGLDEAGVDGGGLFREFLSELLKTAFDPNRGFFRLTKDNLLYPNPNVHLIVEDFPKHYFFIGRMLGKVCFIR